jgi:GDPmannose 4,6-dehydratase
VYNLAAQSFVGRSWKEPVHTAEVTGLGALRVFEAARIAAPEARIYQASTSEMFGLIGGKGTEEGPFHPRSPYGTAKLFAHTTAVNYRESYGMHISCGILFNHESPRRSPQFVTRKVCIAAARAARGDTTLLRLGALDARRDWGWAPDYVAAMIQMSRREHPGDFIVATGVSHSVADLCEVAYRAVGLNWRDHVTVDPAFVRPAEIPDLVGEPERATRELGWTAKVGFAEMIERMVAHELGDDVHFLKRRAG